MKSAQQALEEKFEVKFDAVQLTTDDNKPNVYDVLALINLKTELAIHMTIGPPHNYSDNDISLIEAKIDSFERMIAFLDENNIEYKKGEDYAGMGFRLHYLRITKNTNGLEKLAELLQFTSPHENSLSSDSRQVFIIGSQQHQDHLAKQYGFQLTDKQYIAINSPTNQNASKPRRETMPEIHPSIQRSALYLLIHPQKGLIVNYELVVSEDSHLQEAAIIEKIALFTSLKTQIEKEKIDVEYNKTIEQGVGHYSLTIPLDHIDLFNQAQAKEAISYPAGLVNPYNISLVGDTIFKETLEEAFGFAISNEQYQKYTANLFAMQFNDGIINDADMGIVTTVERHTEFLNQILVRIKSAQYTTPASTSALTTSAAPSTQPRNFLADRERALSPTNSHSSQPSTPDFTPVSPEPVSTTVRGFTNKQ